MEQKSGLLRSFPRVFWIANVMELFERGAYYGMNSVLAVYLTNEVHKGGLGFTEQAVGFLQSIIYALTYIIPILGGALADRYGYRRLLLVAFSFMSAGYFLTGYMSTYGAVFASLLVMATGSGLFKPIISGTIARTTNESNSGFGFGIYYWMINMGAFAAPLIVSYLKGFSWQYVFMASSLYCGLMLLPTVFLFRDPPKPENTRTLQKVVSDAAMVLGDARYMLMVFIYSGFWILYFQSFGSILWYLRDFVNTAPVDNAVNQIFAIFGWKTEFKFDSEFVTVLNAGTIIALQVLVSRIVKDIKPLPTMIAGIVFGTLGFLCIGMSTNVWLFVVGMIVFSIGEMTAHPKYYSYIGLVAPADKKAVYMGYSFLYGVVGSLFGSNFGAMMYSTMLKPLMGKSGVENEIRNFWLIFAGLGVLVIVGLMLYNHFLAADTPSTNKTARKIMLGVYAILIAAGVYFIYAAVPPVATWRDGDWIKYNVLFASINYKMLVQAVIMLAIGAGGIAITAKHKIQQ